MAKSKMMELVKGVSAKQHISIHSIVYMGEKSDRHLSIQFARWGSKQSYKAGEAPAHLYPPVTLRGKALKLFKKQDNMVGAAWAMLDMTLAGQVPADMAEDVEMSASRMSDFDGAETELDPGETAYQLDMSSVE